MSIPILASRRELMKAECEKIGLEFVDATAPDPTSEAGVTGAQQFILEDVPKMVKKYGKDTSFFSTNCSMQVPLIKASFDAGAIYTQPCCPSPYHGYPSALGLEVPGDIVGGLQDVIDQTTKIVVDAGLGGRFSTWPVPAAMMATIAGAEYAVKWVNGETNGKVDKAALTECMSDYAGLDITLNPLEDEKIKFQINIADGLPDIYVNKIRIARAIINIFENAINVPCKHQYKMINVDVKPTEKGIYIIVGDNGIGIKKSDIHQIWEVGYSTNNTSGLGLPFAKQIIEDNTGTIEVQSQLDVGTTVKIFLPSFEEV